MIKEYSAGAIVFRRTAGEPLFLLIYTRKSRNWGFPKGHRDEGESLHDTALREIREESGISEVAFIEGFEHELVYPITSKLPGHEGEPAEKHAVYFLAETPQEKVTIDGNEIIDHRWAGYDEALSLLRFDAVKSMLAAARDIVLNRKE